MAEFDVNNHLFINYECDFDLNMRVIFAINGHFSLEICVYKVRCDVKLRFGPKIATKFKGHICVYNA